MLSIEANGSGLLFAIDESPPLKPSAKMPRTVIADALRTSRKRREDVPGPLMAVPSINADPFEATRTIAVSALIFGDALSALVGGATLKKDTFFNENNES